MANSSAPAEITWWPSICWQRDLQDAFWNPDVSVNTDRPDLSRCFQNTVLVWVSCGLLILVVTPIYVTFLMRRTTTRPIRHKSALNLSKMFLSLLLFIVATIGFFRLVNEGLHHVPILTGPVPPDEYIAAGLEAAAFFLTIALIHMEYRKGMITSGVLMIFWIVYLIVSCVKFRSIVMTAQDNGGIQDVFGTTLFFIQFAFLLPQCVLVFFVEPRPGVKVTHYTEKTPLLAASQKNGEISESDPEAIPSPESESNWISNMMYIWFTKMIIKGWKKSLVFDDLYDLMDRDKCKTIVPAFLKEWYAQLPKARFHATEEEKKKVSVMKAILWSLGRALFMSSFYRFLSLLVIFLNPILLQILLQYIQSEDPYEWKGYVYALGILTVLLVHQMFIQRFLYHAYNFGMWTRTGITAAIYRKAIRLSSAAKRQTTVGEIVNLMSVDVQKLQDLPPYLSALWTVPILSAIAMTLLWQVVGPSCLVGIAILALLIPLNGVYVGNQTRKLQEAQMIQKDKRIRVMNEILSGIKVLKLYAWEPSFKDRIERYREKELVTLKWANILNAISAISWNTSTYLVTFAIFAVYTQLSDENVLTADKAFVTMSLVNTLQLPLVLLPYAVTFTGQGIVSLRRIQKFLLLEEVEEDVVEYDGTSENALTIENGSFSWGKEDAPTLQNIDLAIKPGSLVAIVGTVGAGKSSLISAVLGEMWKDSGTITINGSLAYVPQQAWIQNKTVRDNIVFGKPFIKEKYERVLSSCALKADLAILSDGDMTEIGEKGINLSGGQKARVSVARAVYQEEDIYLLDDPLSAVDAHVGRQLFHQVLGPRGMLAGKTRILVTHSISWLSQMDTVIVLTQGKISEMGTYDELMERDGGLAEFLRNYLATATSDDSDDNHDMEDGEQIRQIREKLESMSSTTEADLVAIPRQHGASAGSLDSGVTVNSKNVRRRKKTISRSMSRQQQAETTSPKKLIAEETSQVGTVKWENFGGFMKACGRNATIITMVFYTLYLSSLIMSNIWLSYWTSDPLVNGTMPKKQTNFRLGVYGGFILMQICTLFVGAIGVALGCVSASRILHSSLLGRLLRAPMAFFDTTPLGRIMNRVSKDIDYLDVNIPMILRQWFYSFLPLLSTVFLISYSTPIFLAAAVPIGVLYFIAQKLYITTARQLRRVDSIKRSPLFIHFDETIVGASSIRAYKKQHEFIDRCDTLIDESQRAWYLVLISQRWLGCSMETLGAVVAFLATVFAVLQKEQIGAGVAGMSVSYSLQICIYMNGYLRNSAELETYMVAVERIQEYCKIETEAAWEVKQKYPGHAWPNQGRVEYKDYSTRYRPGLELVLKEISYQVNPGEKVGIVGRTGAGKSSMALSLFRLIEATAGSIYIDGIDIANLGLQDLRSRLTIIPQDPVIFSGSLRLNLDPFERHTDKEVYGALSHAYLKEFVDGLPAGLEYECGENGEALSVGQRQLVCLARALLRRTKILVLDEATAAVDLETDELIQTTIRTAFQNSTIITIAHRLNTIMDYDRVLVMSDGKIVEFASPSALLEDTSSMFYSLARDAALV